MHLYESQWWEVILIATIAMVSFYALIITWLWLKPHKSRFKTTKSVRHDVANKALIQIKADEAMRLHQTFQKLL